MDKKLWWEEKSWRALHNPRLNFHIPVSGMWIPFKRLFLHIPVMLGTWFSLAINRSVNLSYPWKTFLTCIELTDYSRPWEHEGFDLTFFTPSTKFIDMFMLLLCRTDGHRNSLEVSLPRRSAQVGSKTEELDLYLFSFQ